MISSDHALRVAVGGEFEAIGKLEIALLRQFGLGDEPALVVDVGCGSGRLALQLAPYPQYSYVGMDIVADLILYAHRLIRRSDWVFIETQGTKIRCVDGAADFVCFFSVFTHLFPQDIYRYLQEAKRVLKPGGKIAFTFLEFRLDSHWRIFESTLNQHVKNVHLDQLISRDAIEAWAKRLGLSILALEDGDRPHIPLQEPILYEDGRTMEGLGHFGQSVCVLQNM